MCSSSVHGRELLFFQLYDLLFFSGVMKLRPKFPLRACPCSANFTSFATMAALSVTWFMFFESLHKQLISCSLRRFEFNKIPHCWNSLFLSSSENRFRISLLNVSLSRRRSLTLSPEQKEKEQALCRWYTKLASIKWKETRNVRMKQTSFERIYKSYLSRTMALKIIHIST